ncbi:Potassium transporter, putative [Theobroma cacao]|uniref:Potassium transporter, putative n=1 Tax=Theobroma cacao TaxID=3641 RepID=A0A061DQI8_THECC|nr:Potassium transporter, putative [Theobroma cacao]
MSSVFVQHPIQETGEDQAVESKDTHEEVSNGKKHPGHKCLRRYDSLDLESAKVISSHYDRVSQVVEWSVILQLAFQSIGVVYGDIGTPPLYVYAGTFAKGGTFALYSLICRCARMGLIPSQQAEDRGVSNFQLELPTEGLKRASKIKSKLENRQFAKLFLLTITMLGTPMVIGDGVLTPCISVLSAVGGIKEATAAMTEDRIVWISVAIWVCLFMVQRFGTDKVGYRFAPILCVWRNKKDAWVSLGGIVLAITGTEALFADVGHFTVRSIQISICTVTCPALILAYTGQFSFLRKHENFVSDAFFKSIPGPLYWPMFVLDVAAAIIAIVHTSAKYEGQVYIPEVNYLLMLACVGVTVGVRTTEKIGDAYGIAVVFVMTPTSSLLVLLMIMIWKTSILLVTAYILVIGSVELVYLSSVLYKFDQGGYLPLAFAAGLMTMMLREITADTSLCRIPGLAMFYSELVHCIPPIYEHYVANVPALLSVLVFVSIKSLPISKVAAEERFLFRRVEPKELNVFRCVVRYGYADIRNEQESFEWTLVEGLKEFIKENVRLSHVLVSNRKSTATRGEEWDNGLDNKEDGEDNVRQVEEDWQEIMEKEINTVDKT